MVCVDLGGIAARFWGLGLGLRLGVFFFFFHVEIGDDFFLVSFV